MRIGILTVIGAGLLMGQAGVLFAGPWGQTTKPSCPTDTHWLSTAYGGYCAPGENYTLVDPKSHAPVSTSAKIAALSDSASNSPEYARLVLRGMGCPASGSLDAAQTGQPDGAVPGGAKAQGAPCKLSTLYIDPDADGTASGRALMQALSKTLREDGRINLVASQSGADVVFMVAAKYQAELAAAQQAAELAREKHGEAEVAEQAKREEVEAAEQAKREEAEAARAARQFAAAGRVGVRRPYIAYAVETDCDNAQVDLTFDVGVDQVEQRTEDAPWAELITYSRGGFYYLSAQKQDGSDYCSVTAAMYLVRLTRKQVDLWSSSPASPTKPIKRYGKELREADSDTAFGIASVGYNAPF